MVDGLQERLEQWLRQAGLPGDGRIPAERVLARELAVSRAELRKVLATLEDQGRLVRHVGRGSFLRPLPVLSARPGGGHVGEPAVSAVSPRALIVARLALEPVLARSAAREASDADLDRLHGTSERVADAATWSEFDEADLAFHRAIAALSTNPLLIAAFEPLAEAWLSMRWGALRQRDAAPRGDGPAVAEHEAVRAALVGRDAPGAEAALRRHIMTEAAELLGGGF